MVAGLGLAAKAQEASTSTWERITAPVLLIWGDNDVYGGPELGRPAVRVLANGRLEVMAGGHAPFLDDPSRCAALIAQAV